MIYRECREAPASNDIINNVYLALEVPFLPRTFQTRADLCDTLVHHHIRICYYERIMRCAFSKDRAGARAEDTFLYIFTQMFTYMYEAILQNLHILKRQE